MTLFGLADFPIWGEASTRWRQAQRGGSKPDRMVSEIRVAVGAQIAGLEFVVPSHLASRAEQIAWRLSQLEAQHARRLGALSNLLIRSESIATSQIEAIDASTEDYARALGGQKGNASATKMVEATRALGAFFEAINPDTPIDLPNLLTAHEALMTSESNAQPGQLRTVQNWIGGNQHSPLGAQYIPPAPSQVANMLSDLLAFCARQDMPVLVQAAIAHAQFESIHPFVDGNGRIGRALMNGLLKHRKLTPTLMLPLAGGLAANRQCYFDALTSFRHGNAEPIVLLVMASAEAAIAAAGETSLMLEGVSRQWAALVAGGRATGPAQRAIQVLQAEPIISAERLAQLCQINYSNSAALVAKLHELKIIEPLTQRKRNQIWAAKSILNEMDDFMLRVQTYAANANQ